MRLYLSDLHLEDPASPAFATLQQMLQGTDADAVYILGDLTEVWVGDDDDGPIAAALKELLKNTAARRPVFLMHGNRDFLMGEELAAETGVTLLSDPALLDDGTLLAHGDAFCIDDEAYQEVRRLFRSESWQQDILAQSLDARRALARNLREESQRTNANKAANIMDVAEAEVARVVKEHGATRLIHGHTHRPGRHLSPWGYRYVLGAWERCAWIARQAPGEEPELSCLPFAAS
jgi:UDP-2,3-diacylglucosamine hydrolase